MVFRGSWHLGGSWHRGGWRFEKKDWCYFKRKMEFLFGLWKFAYKKSYRRVLIALLGLQKNLDVFYVAATATVLTFFEMAP